MSAKSGLWNRFQSHKGGNVAIIFGLSALFLVAVTGGAVDFSRINDARNKMQDAADIAVLRGALTASQGDTVSELAAQQAFDDNFNASDVTLGAHSLKKTVVDNISKLNYTATATIKPYFLGLVGLGTQTLSVSSTAQSEVNPFELALVLDVTGSMNQSSKLTNLKSSVTSVLNSLLDANGQNSSDVKVGVVPFNTQVRMPTSATNAYVDYTKCSTTESSNADGTFYSCHAAYKVYDSICANAKSSNKATCLSSAASKMFYKVDKSAGVYSAFAVAYEKIANNNYTIYTYTVTLTVDPTTHKATYASSAGTPATKQPLTAYQYYTPPNGYTAFKSTPIFATYASSWAGCVIDRGQPYDVSADTFATDALDSAYQAANCTSSPPAVIQDMTTSISSTKTYVNALVAGGNTNITIGVQMGMELLSPDAPYTQGVAFGDPDMDKYMIVVTDGDNTQNRWTSTQADIDARTALACQAAKDKGITIFVVRVMDGNSSMLQKCASKTIYYYDLSSASQLNATMADIFLRIGKLRLVQ
ncbi:VWA domain-containing protein [Asticcacaulis taihuensis]|uniref:vWA domain-containing protein n=1 Tax=Asticcacaulis taihuensis TaxID=260084 RepID=UPI003F7B75AF